jgi:LacI family transcriptional regulator
VATSAVARHVVTEKAHDANPYLRKAASKGRRQTCATLLHKINRCRGRQFTIVQIASRIAGNDHPFIGIDSYSAGGTAAFCVTNMLNARSGTLLTLRHSSAYQVQKDRIHGFSVYLTENPNPAYLFALVMFGMDDHLRSAKVFGDAVKIHPDTTGIYNAGGSIPASPRYSNVISAVTPSCPTMRPRFRPGGALDTLLSGIGFLDVEISSEPVPFLAITAENL